METTAKYIDNWTHEFLNWNKFLIVQYSSKIFNALAVYQSENVNSDLNCLLEVQTNLDKLCSLSWMA